MARSWVCTYSRIVSMMNGLSLTFVRTTVTGLSQLSLSPSGFVIETSTWSGLEDLRKWKLSDTRHTNSSLLRPVRNSGGALERKIFAKSTASDVSLPPTSRPTRSHIISIAADSSRIRLSAVSVVSLIGKRVFARVLLG